MPLGEFALIERYFDWPPLAQAPGAGLAPGAFASVVLGVGDDCALLAPAAGQHLAVSTDTLVEGRHFLSTVAPERLGHKALAVNLSDLAACGARPLAFTLALCLPRVDEAFLEGLSRGMRALASRADITLVGGDTTAGPLALTVTVMGEVPAGAALLRSGARPGDAVWVSGTLGDARLALEAFRGTVSLEASAFESARRAMEQPEPRVALGLALRGLATSAIDLSDGLLGDLSHILRRSGVGARVQLQSLPRSAHLQAQPEALQRRCLLAGGDDYELLFTAPGTLHAQVREAAARAGVAVTAIGEIVTGAGLQVLGAQGEPVSLEGLAGFDHFAG
ncbi:MAG: thiamine-phosphate kinase [Rubrivivax sp.]